MAGEKYLLRQHARGSHLYCIAIALLLAGAVLILVPGAPAHPLAWFAGLFAVAYLLARWTLTFPSWIERAADGALLLGIRDNNARANAYVALQYITRAELCSYDVWHRPIMPDGINRPYHRVFRQAGYRGPGLMVCYRLPRQISGDDELRSWQFPAPRAANMLALIEENSPAVAHSS